MKATVWFDMDGTIANLYAVDGWLASLREEDPAPYMQATVMHNMARLARQLHKLQAAGYGVGIISWTSKGGSDLYNAQVALAKLCWLEKHLPSITWDEINIVEYGTPKYTFKHNDTDILFDDEESNRKAWGKYAYDQTSIFTTLATLTK